MSLLALLIVASGAVFSLIWLLTYVPLTKKSFGAFYSPRLLACKILVPFDVSITLFLMIGGLTGLLTTVTGIGMAVYNVCVAVGISIGVGIVHKYLKPKWEKEYEHQLHLYSMKQNHL